MSAFGHIPCPWLDVTRLLTRVGRGVLTGIDRVEHAYLTEAIATGCDSYLCRTTRGYLRLDKHGANRLLEMIANPGDLPRADALSRLTFRGNRPRHRAEAALRALAVDRCRPNGLPAMIRRGPHDDLTYLNVGHANLSEATLQAFADHPRSLVLIHDLIPLTHPQYVVDGQPANFAGRVERVRRHASHVIANSAATARDLSDHWQGQDLQPTTITAPLGVERRPLSDDLNREPGHFMMLGTIEARKNHALMLDVWDLLAQEVPRDQLPTLHIIGPVGWKVEGVMDRLRAHPLFGDKIRLNGPHGLLDDAAVQDHLARATALLFPSLAEGYGFPALEAALAGATPICSDLAVFRETMGDCAVYVDSADAYQWKETIKQHLGGSNKPLSLSNLTIPTWQEHFEIVADAIIPKAGWSQP